MNLPKCRAEDYIQWLIASPKVASCTQAANATPGFVAHDSYTRLLERLEPESETLWQEVKALVCFDSGWLVLDDTTLDKHYAKKMELVTRHWSGKHRAVVQGINLITLLWTNGEFAIPIDWRIFNKDKDKLSKNDHLWQMLQTARQRGFQPTAVLWDSWYSSLKNLKLLRSFGWDFFVALKSNRQVSYDNIGNHAVSEVAMKAGSKHVHLKGYGWVELYKAPANTKEEGWRYFIGTESPKDEAQVQYLRETANQIEVYHRGLKQECHVERCQARKERKQRNHIALAIRAFVRLEAHRYNTGITRFEAKFSIVREAIRSYLEAPLFTLSKPTA